MPVPFECKQAVENWLHVDFPQKSLMRWEGQSKWLNFDRWVIWETVAKCSIWCVLLCCRVCRDSQYCCAGSAWNSCVDIWTSYGKPRKETDGGYITLAGIGVQAPAVFARPFLGLLQWMFLNFGNPEVMSQTEIRTCHGMSWWSDSGHSCSSRPESPFELQRLEHWTFGALSIWWQGGIRWS